MELLIKIKPISGVPLYRILADAIRESIKEQQLPRGQRLPSSRALSKQYKLSISTVLRAYEELCSQGIVVTSAKSGSRVSARFDCSPIVPENPAAEVQAAVRLSQYARHLSHSERLTSPPREAGIMIPSVDYLPTSAWQRLIIKNLHCYEHDTDLYDYSSDPFGYAPLREVIADYIRRTRGIHCDVEQVAVTSSVRLDLACRMLIDSGDVVAVENPCFPAARKVFLSHGANIENIDTDIDGLVPGKLFANEKKFRLLYLCPSHQDPSGVSLSPARRNSIMDWSIKTGTIIWENDFDCNYYYSEQPQPALFSWRDNDTVIYSGSFWLTLGPLASSGFVVLPHRYINAFRSLLATVHSEHPVLENYVLTEFIKNGHLEKHIHRQRRQFLKNRQRLIHSLSVNLRELVAFKGSSGVHTLLTLDERISERTILQSANNAELNLKPTRFYYADQYPINEFMVPFSQIRDESINDVVTRFSSQLKESLHHSC